jgi:deazaflavin-dependent oxidoreductase (nitroreductase family)
MRGAYLPPPWGQRHIANRLVPIFRKDIVSRLSVRGRKSGRWHTVPVAVLAHDGERYLVSYRGFSDWALNLAAAKRARLQTKEGLEEIAVDEVPVGERGVLLEVYGREFARMPTVSAVLEALPDPADHPIFRITSSADTSPG